MFFFTSELSCSDHQQVRLVAVKRRNMHKQGLFTWSYAITRATNLEYEGLNGMVTFTGKRLYFGFTVQFTVNFFLTFLNLHFTE